MSPTTPAMPASPTSNHSNLQLATTGTKAMGTINMVECDYNESSSKALQQPRRRLSSNQSNMSNLATSNNSLTRSNSNISNVNSSNNSTEGVDFIGPSKAVKHLFSLPYNSESSVSVALHTIGNGTILLDSGEEYADYKESSSNAGNIATDGSRTVRHGRRRQRPSSWSNSNQHVLAHSEDANSGEEGDAKSNLDQFQLAQLRQGERRLLESLSALLEEAVSDVTNSEQGHEGNRSNEEAVVVNDLGDDELEAESDGHFKGAADSASNSNTRSDCNDEMMQSEKSEESLSLIVPPSNALVVSGDILNKSTGSSALTSDPNPMISNSTSVSPSPTKTRPHIMNNLTNVSNVPNTTHRNNDANSDPNDMLANELHPPQHYLSHVVAPPPEPRQYLNWKFQDMKLLVASDALIYRQDGSSEVGGGSDGTNHPNDHYVHPNACDSKGEHSIAIRVADASDLRSKMEFHQNMVKEGPYATPTGTEIEGFFRGQTLNSSQIPSSEAYPPNSYAEALLKNPSFDSEHQEETEGDKSLKEAKESTSSTSFSGQSELESVKLQTCIIPSSGVGPEWSQFGFSLSPFPPDKNSGAASATSPTSDVSPTNTQWSSAVPFSSTPVCTVMDAYLDNIMANVPQLALLLREHGFVQNIKLIRTEDIPSLMMHPSTLGVPSSMNDSNHTAGHQPIFSPEIVEMNAAMLLRFLKTNCTRENCTYLLHRSAGDTNIQLFDISSISQLRQRKWIWWLMLCSYRFACRLEQLQKSCLSPDDKFTRREYRKRQRSLLHNTLNLLEELADMDGGRHETIGAAVCEHLADTYLWNDEADGDVGVRDSSKPVPLASSSQPYRKVTVDCLNKAHDHLMNGIRKLNPLFTKAKKEKSPSIEIEAISMQLYGIHHKMINVCLRLADHHLQNYFSSNLIHALRTAARMLSDATSLLSHLNIFDFSDVEHEESNSPVQSSSTDAEHLYGRSILVQYAWLWEYCGHFARSFAADELWRERGHTCGNDLISLFSEVESSCNNIVRQCFRKSKWKPKISVNLASHGQVSLKSLSGLVVLPTDFEQIEESVLQKEGCHEAIATSKSLLNQQTQIKRDMRIVLVAASLCYSNAIDSYVFLAEHNEQDGATSKSTASDDNPEQNVQANVGGKNLVSLSDDSPLAPLLRQRLGDACNEIGKILLNEGRLVLSPDSPGVNIGKGNSFGLSHVSAIMLSSAKFWFHEGLKQFTAGGDLRNIALLRCNLCQCCKIQANANVMLPGMDKDISKECNPETFLQEAVDHLVFAHEAMGQRDSDPLTWDMVSEELAATLLVLGVRRRQSSLMGSNTAEPLILQALRLTPGKEKAIVEPIERSCKIYESLGTAHAAHQAAAAHYQLAIYFSKVWTCQRDEAKTREKLAAAFKHFTLAHQYFFSSVRGNEPTFVILSLDFSNLYSAVSGEECLSKALACCLDCRTAFSPDALASAMERLEKQSNVRTATDARDWFSKMKILAENVDGRISKLLLSLVKIEKDNNAKQGSGGAPSDKYKNMYRQVLTHKMSSSKSGTSSAAEGGVTNDLPSSFPVYDLLESLSEFATPRK